MMVAPGRARARVQGNMTYQIVLPGRKRKEKRSQFPLKGTAARDKHPTNSSTSLIYTKTGELIPASIGKTVSIEILAFPVIGAGDHETRATSRSST